jgi:hypothetical protein
MRLTAIISALMFLAACGDEQPAAPTAQESEQLDEAEELLNQEAEADNAAG